MEGVLQIENHREIRNHEESTEFRVRDMGVGGAVVVVVSKIEWEPFLILNSAWPGSMSLELEKWTQLKYIF